MGISNELFQTEHEANPACQFANVPNTVTDTAVTTTPAGLSAIETFAFFQLVERREHRLLAVRLIQ